MVATFTPDTSPDVLEWARKVINLPRDVAAKRIGVDPIQIDYWEIGAESPTISQLRELARVYHRPLAVLLRRSLPPGEEPITRDFRLLPQNQNKDLSPELRLGLWRVEYQRDIAHDLARQDREMPDPIDFDLDQNESPDSVGVHVRSWLGVPVAILELTRPRANLDLWIDAIEAKSILVAEISRVKLEEMRGCSISDQPFPAIILNSADTPNGKVFTLLHELAHILLHSGGLCDLEVRKATTISNKVHLERFCNELAAAVLMPRDLLLREARKRHLSPSGYWNDQDLLNIAQTFGVSREAMLIRLIGLNLASRQQYDALKPHFEEIYEEWQTERLKKPGRFNYYRTKIRQLGKSYASTVIDAYDRDVITSVEVADYLDMKTKNVPNLRKELGDSG
jgi:Zn-dependent peptidase ImmA (M78 family)